MSTPAIRKAGPPSSSTSKGKSKSAFIRSGGSDFGSEGLIILTNDGEFTNVHDKSGQSFRRCITSKLLGFRRVLISIAFVAAPTLTRNVSRLAKSSKLKSGENPWFKVTLHQGRNQQIRRMFQAIGHPVEKLRRVRIGFLEDAKLRPGRMAFSQRAGSRAIQAGVQ